MDLETRLTLRIPPDHTWWAKSLRWSCGRPHMPSISLNFDHDAAFKQIQLQWRIAGYVGLGISAVDRPFRVLDIS